VKYETKKKPNKTVLTKSSGNSCSPASCVNDAKPKALYVFVLCVGEHVIFLHVQCGTVETLIYFVEMMNIWLDFGSDLDPITHPHTHTI